MANNESLLGVIKKIILEVNESSKPVNVVFGVVKSEKPLKIQVDQKLMLTEKQLVLTRNVTDYKLSMSVDHKTEIKGGGLGADSFAEHTHNYRGTKLFVIHNNLKIDEKVLMIRMQTGQKYVVIDRLVSE